MDVSNFNDQPISKHIIELENNRLILQATDPYGYWTVHFERGQVPKELQGAFTSKDEAMKIVTPYLERTKREVKATEIIDNGSST